MSVQVYGCNHVAIEVDDVEKAVAFYQDVFNLQKLDEGEGPCETSAAINVVPERRELGQQQSAVKSVGQTYPI